MPRILAIAILCVLALPADARGKQVAYVGGHPIPGGGWCEIEGPHVHLFAPEHATELYRVTNGRYYFVGDPVPFGYHGERHAYAGRHPIVVGHDEAWCYLDGPHFHAFAAPHDHFVDRGGVAWYVGDWPRRYHAEGARRVTINAIYKPLVYARPIVVVAPPPGYHVPVIEVVHPVEVVYIEPYHHHHHHKHHHHHDDDDDDDDDD
jgi:hypothetical protein